MKLKMGKFMENGLEIGKVGDVGNVSSKMERSMVDSGAIKLTRKCGIHRYGSMGLRQK